MPFEFTPEQFALICSDLESVPLSFAVAASSAVPILLSPVTVRNYAGTCTQAQGLETGMSHERNLSARVLHRIAESYRNAKERPYILELFRGSDAMEALVVEDALYCGNCSPRSDPIPLPDLGT